MEFFNNKNAIRKVGVDKYIIGDRPLDPLVSIDGKSIYVVSGDFKNLTVQGNPVLTGLNQPSVTQPQQGSSGAFAGLAESFTVPLESGKSVYRIDYPRPFEVPPTISTNIQVDGESEIIPHIVSGVGTTHYHVVFSTALTSANYHVHTLFGGTDNRYMLEEAFEFTEDGDLMPTDGHYISDTMWILRNDNELELRDNFWRYNTGPEAFTNEISF